MIFDLLVVCILQEFLYEIYAEKQISFQLLLQKLIVAEHESGFQLELCV